MIKDNPIISLVPKYTREYQKLVRKYSLQAEELLRKYSLIPTNQTRLEKWLFHIADLIIRDTEKLLYKAVEEVVDKTFTAYNEKAPNPLKKRQLEEIKIDILKKFFTSTFMGKTVNLRLKHADRRLKVNLKTGLTNLIGMEKTRVKDLKFFTHSITGRDFIQGGSAFKWNSRLVLSEMFRAYQFSAVRLLEELDAKEIKWVNSDRIGDNNPAKGLEGTYPLNDVPDYPYPCNDSYFIPIY